MSLMSSRQDIIPRALRRIVAALVAVTTIAAVAPAQGRSPEAILARYNKAVDPGNRIPTLQGFRSVGQMEMPGMGVATMTTLQRRPDKMLMTINFPGVGEIKQGFDGTTAWSSDPMSGPRILSEAETKQMRDGANFEAMARSPSLFVSMEPAGEVDVNGDAADCIKLTWKTERVTTECYSRASGLLVETRITAATPQGEIESVTRMFDYREVAGVKMPHRLEQQLMGSTQIITMTEVEAGPIDAKLFELPAEIKALKKP